MVNILSFDVEDWYHILDNPTTKTEAEWNRFPARINTNLDRILEVLDRTQQKATFFCLGWIARKYPDAVKNISSRGHEIACHSDMHQLVYELGPKGFRADLRNAVASIQDATGTKVIAYRAPGFSVTAKETGWFFEALGEQGIEVDCSVFVGTHGHGGIPGFPTAGPCLVRWSGGAIKEFPMNVGRILGRQITYSGGGYFRLMPYFLIRSLAARTDYIMTYFHPRDFDPEQPRVPGLSPIRRFKSYVGLGTALDKLERLIHDFRFVELRAAIKAVDWTNKLELAITADCIRPIANQPAR